MMRWALFRPIPLTDLRAFTFSDRIASRSSLDVMDDRIILAEAAPIPETPVIRQNSSRSSLLAKP